MIDLLMHVYTTETFDVFGLNWDIHFHLKCVTFMFQNLVLYGTGSSPVHFEHLSH